MSTLDLFDPPAQTETEKGLGRAQDAAAKHAGFIGQVRELVRRYHRNRRITTDQVWFTMERCGITLPEDMHPNALGSFFTGWEHAEPVYIGEGEMRQRARRRSERPGSHGNLLSVWWIQ